MELIFIGFITGLLGSIHCVGMCGPIAMAIPVVNNNLFISKLVYNFGRILTYALLGFFAGVIGERIYLEEFQSYFSIISGIILITGILIYFNQTKILKLKIFRNYLYVLKNNISEYFKIKKYKSIFVTGILNGILPCGFIYIALSGAVITGNKISGMFYMILFGLGTLPLMMGVSVYGSRLKILMGRKFAIISPVFLTLVAIILILRGMNLGIPLISPDINKDKKVEMLICE